MIVCVEQSRNSLWKEIIEKHFQLLRAEEPPRTIQNPHQSTQDKQNVQEHGGMQLSS